MEFSELEADFRRITADPHVACFYGSPGQTFHVLQLRPWRVQILLAEQLAVGDLVPRSWRAP
jgi:hypothetical protein